MGKPKLSDRLRPNVECAPWVIDEVKKLETRLDLLLIGENEKGLRALIEEAAKLICDRCRIGTPLVDGGHLYLDEYWSACDAEPIRPAAPLPEK